MRFLYELVAAVPAVGAGLSISRVVASLDAPNPWPQLTFLAVTLLTAYVLDRLIDPIRAHYAARRG